MVIRPYRAGDEAALVDLWNMAAPQDGINSWRFRQKILLDANFDPRGLLVAEEQGDLAGWLLALTRQLPMRGTELEEETGWITAFGVHPACRRRGIGTQLFDGAGDFFRDRGRNTVYFASYAPHYFLPGIDAEVYPAGYQLLQREGFRVLYSPVSMDKNLVGFTTGDDVREVSQRLSCQGYEIGALASSAIWPLLDFVAREFDADWLRAIREALAGGVPEGQILVARGPGASVAGFAMYGGYDGIGERFGPFGVARALRGTGLGKVLLYRTLEAMAQAGMHSAWFLWTGEQEPAGHLYRRAGFAVTRPFHVMVKDLKGGQGQ